MRAYPTSAHSVKRRMHRAGCRKERWGVASASMSVNICSRSAAMRELGRGERRAWTMK